MIRTLISEAAIVLCLLQPVSGQLTSGNPIIRHIRSADPSAHVWRDGQVWVYASHDQDDATDYSTMEDYHVFSSYDLVNWTDHGVILHSGDVEWGNPDGGFMFAPTAAYRDGTYYFYFPHLGNDWKWHVGVATSHRPQGPFTDRGYVEGPDNIDPCCFMDDDATAYMIWGGDGDGPTMARLKENMMELDEAPRLLDYGAENFGEGPYMHKRDGIYYLSWTCNTCSPYQAYYSVADSPYGPFEYKGSLKTHPPGAQDHHSMIEYHGQWYYFYHTGNYAGGSLFRRNVCVDSLYYHEDGSMKEVIQTTTGVGADSIGMAPGSIVPGRFEAEDFFRQSGCEIRPAGDTALLVAGIQQGDQLKYVLQILGDEEYRLSIRVLDLVEGTGITLLVDGQPADTLMPEVSPDTLVSSLSLVHGKHTFGLRFSHEDPDTSLVAVDWLELSGDISYFSIDAGTTEGGTVYPEGRIWVPEGDSISFAFENEHGYQFDSLVVDGVARDARDTWTFTGVQANHTLRAYFSPCKGKVLVPYYRVDQGGWVRDSAVTLTEGHDLSLKVEHEGEGALTWAYPDGSERELDMVEMAGIRPWHSGTYRVTLENPYGCKSTLDFKVLVEPVVLDVYQAEEWLDQSGLETGDCRDWGVGKHVTSIQHGDWCSYGIRVEKVGIYAFTARVATADLGGYISVLVDGQEQAMVYVSGDQSDGWQDWFTTAPVDVSLAEGERLLKLQFIGSSRYMFNLNWFDLEYSRELPVPVQSFHHIPLYLRVADAGTGRKVILYGLEHPCRVRLSVVDLSGRPVRVLLPDSQQERGAHEVFWDGLNEKGMPLPAGLYLVVLTTPDRREVVKIICK